MPAAESIAGEEHDTVDGNLEILLEQNKIDEEEYE